MGSDADANRASGAGRGERGDSSVGDDGARGGPDLQPGQQAPQEAEAPSPQGIILTGHTLQCDTPGCGAMVPIVGTQDHDDAWNVAFDTWGWGHDTLGLRRCHACMQRGGWPDCLPVAEPFGHEDLYILGSDYDLLFAACNKIFGAIGDMGRKITEEINADPQEVERLRRSRQQAHEMTLFCLPCAMGESCSEHDPALPAASEEPLAELGVVQEEALARLQDAWAGDPDTTTIELPAVLKEEDK